jgi:hypothetical protein
MGDMATKEGIYDDIPNWDYHNLPEHSALSAGGIKSLLRSPAHFQTSQTNKDNKTPALLFGSATHSYILQPGLGEVIVIPDINRRTKEGKQEYEKFMTENEKNIIIDSDSFKTIKEMREVLMKHNTARMLLEKGTPELSGFWNHEIYDFLCKCRPDFLVDDLKIIVDYKTTNDASAEEFGKSVVKFGYHIQAAWYRAGIEIITEDDWDFVFIAQEKTPPYSVAVYQTPVEVFSLGEMEMSRAAKIYNDCLKSGEWNAYPDTIQTILLPKWARS